MTAHDTWLEPPDDEEQIELAFDDVEPDEELETDEAADMAENDRGL